MPGKKPQERPTPKSDKNALQPLTPEVGKPITKARTQKDLTQAVDKALYPGRRLKK